MFSRIDLDKVLREVLGSNNVYYQPPESVKLKYPAIVYSLNDIRNDHADNEVYKQTTGYTVTVIDRDPEHEIAKKISKLPCCRMDRSFTSDNLYHITFTINY